MKIRIEIDEDITSDEIIIHCKQLTPEILQIQEAISQMTDQKQLLTFFKNDTEYYFPLDEILFFETDTNGICAHTIDDIYLTHYKLYELEEILPGQFMRISKSAILNTKKIYSITKNLSSFSIVQFQNTHKQVSVSRNYYRPLKYKLEEKRYVK